MLTLRKGECEIPSIMAIAIRSVPELTGKVADDFAKRAREAEARFHARAGKPARLTPAQKRRVEEARKLAKLFCNV